jgi:hypothetical protein
MFISAAMDYYVAGRFAVFAGINPTAGNLLHHAVEMCLKGALAKKGMSLKELEKMRHKLRKIWGKFKAQYTGDPSDLKDFDEVIAELDSFEEIRYPDKVVKQGMSCVISPGSRPKTPPPHFLAEYQLYLDEIDRLVWKVFERASINFRAFAQAMTGQLARKYLNEEIRRPAHDADPVFLGTGARTRSVVAGR